MSILDAARAARRQLLWSARGSCRGARQRRLGLPLRVQELENRCLPSFGAPAFYNTGEAPQGLAVGDFNGDGILDLVTANDFAEGTVSVLLGNGDGSFQPPVDYAVGPFPWAVVVRDFNNDGLLDLAVSQSRDSTVTILLGDGQGGFQLAGSFGAGQGGANGMAVGDFNGDGNLDLAVGNSAGATVSILLGNGDGTFLPAVSYASSGYPYSVAAGDVNQDGILDLVVTDALGSGVHRLLGRGDGTFHAAVGYSTGPASPSDVALADVNGDGNLDVITSNQNPGSLSVLLGFGNGTFQNSLNFPAGPGASSVAVADFNARGLLDLVTANPGNETVSALRGNGNGTFQNPVAYRAGPFAGSQPAAVMVGDFNGDGFPDLAVTNSRANVVAVLLNQPEATYFQVGAPDTAVAGSSFPITVAALNPLGNVASDYRGTVRFASTDTAATLPSNYTFTAADQGVHTFMVILRTAGNRTVTATDLMTSAIAGTATVMVTPAAASSLLVTGYPSPRAAGEVDTFTVSARDPFGNLASDYRGTVRVTSTDAQAILPRSYTFTVADNGSHIFGAVLRTAGTQALTATDTTSGTITGTQAGIVVNAGAVDHFSLNAPAVVSDGTAFSVSVTARDAFNNATPQYRGTIRFSSSDPRAVLPANYTFEAGDNGTHAFAATLRTVGSQTVVAQDTTTVTITGTATIMVNPILFYPGGSYSVGSGPHPVATGDFNGDGKLDLVTAGWWDNSISVLLGNGDGSFGARRDHPTGANPHFLKVADVNHDGNLDVVVTNFSGNSISVLLGNGDGTFRAKEDFPAGPGPTNLALGDLNGDGYPDVVVTNRDAGTVSILLGRGDGTFQPAITLHDRTGVSAPILADLDGDGHLDLVLGNGFSDIIEVLRGNGDGTFQTPTNYITGAGPGGGVLADLTGNGHLDLLLTHETTNQISILLGNGDGTFQPARNMAAGSSGPLDIEVADYNGDGIPDFAATNTSGNNVTVFLGRGDGTFQSPLSFPVGSLPVELAAGDFNGDGHPDLAVASFNASSVSILLNAGDAPADTSTGSHDRFERGKSGKAFPGGGTSLIRLPARPDVRDEPPGTVRLAAPRDGGCSHVGWSEHGLLHPFGNDRRPFLVRSRQDWLAEIDDFWAMI